MVKPYIGLLYQFVGATRHLQGNGESEGHEETCGLSWELFIWFKALNVHLERALIPVADAEDSQFKTTITYGKAKLNQY